MALLVLSASLGLTSCKSPSPGAGEESGITETSLAPAFDLIGLDGERYRLSDFSGQVVLIEFWATWCGPCRLQAEILSRLYDEVGGAEDIEFLAVSLGEPEETVREFARKDPVPYPVLLDPKETLGYALQVYALPTVMIVDRSGGISYMRPGISDGETLRRGIDAAAQSVEKLAAK